MSILNKLMFWKKDEVQKKDDIREKRTERKRNSKVEKKVNDTKEKIKYTKKEVELRENKKEDFENNTVSEKKEVEVSKVKAGEDAEYNKVKTFKPKKEVKKEIKKEKFDLFGLEIEDIMVGNKYQGEVVGKTNSEYIVFIQGSYNDVILPASKTIQDIKVGDVIEVVVSHRENGNFMASQKDLARYENKEKIQDFIASNAIISGEVIGFKNNVFSVKVADDLTGYCYIRNMEYSYIEDPSEYIGKTFNFEVEQENDSRIDLNRRELSRKEMYEKVEQYQVGDIVEFEEFEIVRSGLVVKKDGLRFFIPFKEVSHSFVSATDDIEAIIGSNKFEIIDIKEREGKDFSLVGSIKKILPNPIDVLKEHYPVDSEIEAEVKTVKDYGVIFTVKGGVSGLLHQNDMSNEDATEMKKWKKGDMKTIKISEYNENNTLKLKSL